MNTSCYIKLHINIYINIYIYIYIERIREIEIIIHITKQSMVQSKTPSYHLLKIESFEYSLIKGSNSNIEC